MNEIVLRGNHQVFKVSDIKEWITKIITTHDYSFSDLTYQFISDEEMIEINRKYLHHDSYTDIITFDYTEENILSADIFISTDRVKENAEKFDSSYQTEMRRVIIHGVLHCLGYPDKTEEEKEIMRTKENECLELFHVEHKM